MGVLALASCVVLSGCGNKPEEAKIVIKDLPTNLIEGGSIDLKDYITVSGGNGGGYSINFDDESFAKITKESETKITLNDFGNVSFKVDYSGISQEATLVVGSKLMDDFAKGVTNAGYDYGLMYEDEYEDTHLENYGEKFIVDAFYSDDAMGGYLEGPDGNVYSFELTYDDQDEPVFSFSVSGMEPTFISDYAKPLDLPTYGYEVTKEEYKGQTYELLTLKEDSTGRVRSIFESFFSIDLDALDEMLEEEGFEVSSFQVMETELSSVSGEKVLAYDTYAMIKDIDPESQTFGQEYYCGNDVLIFNRDFLFKEDVQAYIDSGKQPSSSYEVNVDAIATAVSNHNYQIDYSANWYKCSVSADGTQLIRGAAMNENPFYDEAKADEDSNRISDHFNAIGDFSAYVTPTKTLVDVPNDNAYGLVANPATDNSAWDYAYDPESSTYKTGSAASADTGFGLWHEANYGAFYNYEFLAGVELDEDLTVYSGMFINSKDEDETTNTYTLASKSCYNLFSALFYNSIYDGEIPEDDDWKPSSYKTFTAVASFIFGVQLQGGLYLSDIFDVTIKETYSDSSKTTLDSLYIEFVWLDVIQTAKGYEYYQYVMSTNIDFTNCVMPEFDVVFPVEA